MKGTSEEKIGCICHGMDSMHYREPERSRVTI